MPGLFAAMAIVFTVVLASAICDATKRRHIKSYSFASWASSGAASGTRPTSVGLIASCASCAATPPFAFAAKKFGFSG